MKKKPLDGPLYDFLMARFPDHRSVQGLLEVPRLGGDLGVSYQAVYNAIHANSVSVPMAKRIMALSTTLAEDVDPLGLGLEDAAEIVTREDLLRFVLP